jgi:hypothetical protein
MAVDDAFTIALLHMDGTDASTTFTDESGKTWTANADAQLDTAQYKFGSASGLFDSVGDYVDTGDSSDFDFGTGDWTVDFWIRRNGTVAYPGIISTPVYTAGSGWFIGLGNSTNKFYIGWDGVAKINGTTVVADTTWTHGAVVRYGNSVKLYVDGTLDVSGTDDCTGDSIDSDAGGAVIGRLFIDNDGFYYSGWTDEVRVSKGVARWTANFTPPTAPYAPAESNTGPQITYLSDYGLI